MEQIPQTTVEPPATAVRKRPSDEEIRVALEAQIKILRAKLRAENQACRELLCSKVGVVVLERARADPLLADLVREVVAVLLRGRHAHLLHGHEPALAPPAVEQTRKKHKGSRKKAAGPRHSSARDPADAPTPSDRPFTDPVRATSS